MKKIIIALVCLTAFSCASNKIQENRNPAQIENSKPFSVAKSAPGSLVEISCADIKSEVRSNIKFLVAKVGKEYFFDDSRNVGLEAMGLQGREHLKREIESVSAAQIVNSDVKLQVKLDSADSSLYNIDLKDKVDKIKASNIFFKADHGGSYDRYWMQLELKYGVKNKVFTGRCDLISITDESYEAFNNRAGPNDR